MKKALIISAMPHQKIGGVETYNDKLINLLIKSGYSVDECILKTKKEVANYPNTRSRREVNIVFDSGKNYWYPIAAKNYVRKHLDEYNLIINCSKLFDKKILQSKNHVLVQHTPYEDYEPKKASTKFKWLLERIFLRLGVPGDAFEKSTWAVFYSEYTNIKKKANSANIPLTSEFKPLNLDRKDVLWAARLHDAQKGISHLISIDKLLPKRISVAGDGGDKQMVLDHFKDRYIGKPNYEDMPKLYSSSKVFILTSNYEGAGFTVAEALASGTPVVMFDTFRHAKFYGKCKSVFLIDPFNYNDFAEKVNKILNLSDEEYKNVSKDARKFAEENLTDQQFYENWSKLIERIENDR